MAMCSFADPFSMFDVTPVENLFIEEYMLRAPGDFVKVYIYGLRLCYHPVPDASVATIASALGMEEKTVTDAFAYWERQHLLRRTSDNPPAYSYNNLKAMMVSGSRADDEIPQTNRSFNAALQDLFGTRLLKAQEYERVNGWIEDMHFKPEVVLMLVKHCIATSGKGTAVTFASMEKEAARWAKNGATTLTAAEEYQRTLTVNYEGAQKVLRRFGLRRAPSVDEERLYAKWTEDWGFSLDAILYACAETTKISQPNFAYLDKVLENMHKKQASTSADIARVQKTRTDAMAPVREVLEALGQKSAPTEDLAVLYAGWLRMGFSHESILIAAHCVARSRSQKTMNSVSELLQSWARRSLYTPEAIHAFLRRRNEGSAQLSRIFETAGVERGIADSDRQMLDAWLDRGYSMDLILAAAESAKNAGDAMSYINRVLDAWAEQGIRTPQAARAERARRAQERTASPAQPSTQPAASVSSAPRPSKEVGAHRFTQRAYTDEDLESIFTDPDELDP